MIMRLFYKHIKAKKKCFSKFDLFIVIIRLNDIMNTFQSSIISFFLGTMLKELVLVCVLVGAVSAGNENYATALSKSILFYAAQRSGKLPTIALHQDWTTPCHQQVFLLAQWDNGYTDANCLSNCLFACYRKTSHDFASAFKKKPNEHTFGQ
jgi:hypothetical protein